MNRNERTAFIEYGKKEYLEDDQRNRFIMTHR